MIRATLDTIDARRAINSHPCDSARVDALAAFVGASGRRWLLPPVLVVREGVEYRILDGHHRVAAATAADAGRIPAWVVERADFARLVSAEFAGKEPAALCSLDQHIMANGRPYQRPT